MKLIAKLPYNEDTEKLAKSLEKIKGETFYIYFINPVKNEIYIHEYRKNKKVFRTWKYLEVGNRKEGISFIVEFLNNPVKRRNVIKMEGHTLEECYEMGFVFVSEESFVEEE